MRTRVGTAAIVSALSILVGGAEVVGAQTEAPAACQARSDLALAMGQEDRTGSETAAQSLVTNAPVELADPAAKLTDVLTKRGLGAFETKKFTKALGLIDEYVVANCGLPALAVDAFDYGYEGFSEEIAAGAYVIDFANTAPAEHHELVLFRVRGGASISVKELLALDADGAEAEAVMLGALFAKPDATDSLVVFLEPGRNIFGCFIDVNTTSGGEHDEGHGDEHGGAAKPHWKEGMRGQFEVVGGE
ncbi:MAG: hypothetical protein WD598_03520 [Acidimicrobiia bacterium]